MVTGYLRRPLIRYSGRENEVSFEHTVFFMGTILSVKGNLFGGWFS